MRIGVVGAGDFGKLHLQILSDIPDVEIAYICVRNTERVKGLAESCGARLTSRYKDIIDDKTVDAVSVLTPEQVHFEQVMAALNHGKHVLVEKPITTDLLEAKTLAKKARHTGLVLMPGHTCRFLPAFAKARQYLRDLGQEIVSIYAKRNIPRERLVLHNRIHPVLMALSHDIDQIVSFMPVLPRRVYAMERKTDKSLENPDVFWGLIEYENGCIAALETLWLLPTSARYVDSYMEIATSEKVLHASYPGDGFWVDSKEGHIYPDTAVNDVFWGQHTGALKDEICYFLRCVKENRAPDFVTAEEAVLGIEIGQALMRSASERREILF